jgi:hypothetical protein
MREKTGHMDVRVIGIGESKVGNIGRSSLMQGMFDRLVALTKPRKLEVQLHCLRFGRQQSENRHLE